MKRQILSFTTTAGGAATAVGSAVAARLYAIEYLPGTIDTGATVTITCEGDRSKPLLTKATAGTSNLLFYPRDIVHAVADGAALTGTTGGDRTLPLMYGSPKVVIASGGDTMSGQIVLYYENDGA
jgi:hypothetical protein